MPILIKTISFLSKKERTKAIKLLILILIMAFLDVAGVASIMPFIAVLADPSIIDSNYFLSQIYTKINFSDYHSFMFFLGAMVFLLLSVSIAFKAFTIYKQINFVQVLEYRISSRLVEGYVNQPYSWFLNRHSADLGKNILSEVGGVTSGALMPIMTIISQGIVSAALILLLMIVDLNVALISGSINYLAFI